jgi:hypothetical protein
MIQLEHFILAPFNRLGIRIFKTSHLNEKISESTLIELCRQGGGLKKEVIRITPKPNENIVAVSYLKPVNDDMNRSSIWNHTIIISVYNILELIDLSKVLAPYFIKELADPPEKLEPIEIGTQENE